MSATTASRGFSHLLDAVVRGEEITITRGGHPVAEIRPIRRRTVRELRDRLRAAPAFDEAFEGDVATTAALATSDEVSDPWADS